MQEVYGKELYNYPGVFAQTTAAQLEQFCPTNYSYMETINTTVNMLEIVLLFNGLGFLTAFF